MFIGPIWVPLGLSDSDVTNPNTHNICISSFEAGTVSYNYSTQLFKIKGRENTNADHISS